MFPELHNFGKELSLVMNSGVQFIDFALTINWKAKEWREKGVEWRGSPDQANAQAGRAMAGSGLANRS